MKTKLEMAHDYLLKLIESQGLHIYQSDIDRCFDIVDMVQAEADKRENKETCDKSLNIDSKELNVEEWQPDWSKAPDWANWWAMDGFACSANWYKYEPLIDSESEDEYEWNIDIKAGVETYVKAPSFSYIGNWRDSLRKRPQ